MIAWREATAADVPAVVAMLADDMLGAAREGADLAPYLAAFAEMQRQRSNMLVVGTCGGRVVATYQITILHGLSMKAARRAQIEAVRVVADLRGQGLGAELMADAEARARAAGCRLMQLTTNRARTRAHAFYDRLGFTPSHIGYKRELD
jgi:GNAT superfamily N-acetyltransferase